MRVKGLAFVYYSATAPSSPTLIKRLGGEQ